MVRRRYFLALVLLGLALSVPTAGDGVVAGDVSTTRGVQGAEIPFAHALAEIGNFVGSTAGGLGIALPIAAALLYVGRRADAALLIGVVLLRASNALLKAVAESPRPDVSYGVNVTEQAAGTGFPSGHSMGTVLLVGALVIIASRTHALAGLRRPILGAAVGLVLLTGFGRVYTGAHWPSDVLGGYLWGLTILLAFVTLHRRACCPHSRQAALARLRAPFGPRATAAS